MEKIIASIAVIAALVLVGFGAWHFTSSPTTYSGDPEPITIGLTPYEYSGLIYIAEDQGYFAGSGLNATVLDYNTTLQAIDGLLNDETDVALTSEYVLLGKAFQKENLSVIGNVDKYQSVYLIGRKDREIEDLTDLKGKRIGLTRGTIGEFYLGRFLDLHGVSIQDVTLVDMPPSQYVQALTNGSVDALVAVNKIADQIQERLGSNVVLWSAQSSQPAYYVMACRNDWAYTHPEQIKRLLKSLDLAEKYAINHPAQAKAIVQRKLNLTDAYTATVWPNHQYSLSLDQSLILAMEDEGRWMIKNNLTSEKTIPDFRKYIYAKDLEEVNPEAVNIIS
ncbi:MAG TPA: NrtA/SsuA/CpmA family ABC transporter substrate-binding protein [Methanotrichaceae archaeon]|nr:NrtA/SsuA/CpmA family ABC transporter substrate-binding protein [Methanotrichaceae archaeon]